MQPWIIPCTNCGQEITDSDSEQRWVHVETSEIACADDKLNERGLSTEDGYAACPEHYEDGRIVIVTRES